MARSRVAALAAFVVCASLTLCPHAATATAEPDAGTESADDQAVVLARFTTAAPSLAGWVGFANIESEHRFKVLQRSEVQWLRVPPGRYFVWRLQTGANNWIAPDRRQRVGADAIIELQAHSVVYIGDFYLDRNLRFGSYANPATLIKARTMSRIPRWPLKLAIASKPVRSLTWD